MKNNVKNSGKSWLVLLVGVLFSFINTQVFAQAPGNTCATAVALTLPAIGSSINTGVQTTCGRGNNVPAGFSTVSTLYGGGEDAYYSITVPAGGGNYTFTYSTTVGHATWKILSIHSGCAPTTANTVGGFVTGSSTGGTVTLNLNAGTYILVIDTWPSPNCGQFNLTITRNSPPPPPCASAINIPSAPVTNQALVCNATAVPGALNATNVPTACGGASNFYKGGQDAIYTFTPTTSGNYTISYSGQTWSAIFVYSGACPASGGTCVNSVGSSASSQSLTVNLTAGVEYFIWFDTWPTPNSPCPGTFSITLPVPPYDPCASIPTISGCGVNATASMSGTGAPWNITSCGWTTPGQERIFQFTAPTTGTYQLNVTAQSGGFIDYFWKAASGGCNASGWNCIDDIINPGTYGSMSFTAGTTYYILLDPEGTGSYSATFNLVCPAPPTYDPCASIPTISGCGVNATASMSGTGAPWSITSCGWTTPGQERIFQFTAPTTGTYQINVSAQTGGYIDYFWKAASGGCNASGWNCIDDIINPGIYGSMSFTAGTTYYILLDPEGTGAYSATFNLVCPAVPVAGDNCALAIPISCGGTASGTTVGRPTDPIPGGTCITTDGTGGKVWYSFVGNGDNITASLCTGTSYDSKIWVYSGSCGTPVCVTGNDDGCTPTTQSTVSFPSVNGTTYYIVVGGFGTAQGAYTLNLTCTTPCATTPGTLSVNTPATVTNDAVTYSVSGGTGTVVAYEASFDNFATVAATFTTTANPWNLILNVIQPQISVRAIVQAPGCSTATTNAVTTTLQCATPIEFGNQDGDYITNVTFNTINNTQTTGPILGDGYEDFTSISTNVCKGSTYPLSVSGTLTFGIYQGFSAWIDWNNNGVFEVSEQVLTSGPQATATNNVTIPVTAVSGPVKMRVACRWNGAPNANACDPTMYGWGEIEEYTININVTPCPYNWIGVTSSDWNTPTNWATNFVPTASDNAIIPNVAPFNFPVLDVPVTINDLTINAGASVSVAPGAGLTLDGTLTNNGTFTLQSNATGTAWLDDFTLGGNVVGNIRVQRYVPIGVAGFRQLGTPVNMPNISGLQGFIPSGNSGFVIPLSDCNPNWVAWNSPYGNWMQLVENGPVQFNCYQSLYQVLTSGGMTRGRGYYMDVPGGTTLTFVGAPNTGLVNDYTATHANGAVTNGWNIVSNPYPSPLRWSLADVPAGFDAIAQVWVTSGTYLGTFQPVDPNTPGQGIAIGQAFQLRVSNPGSAVFSVSNANRTTAPPSFLFSGNDPMTLNIDMSKGGHADLTKIRFMDDATPVYDGMFDSYKVLGNANQPMVYSILNNVNMSINSYGNLTQVYTVPLGIKAGTAGEHTFVFSNMDQFPASTLIYLEDTETGTWQNMRTDDSYSFNAPQGTHNGRFLVHFYPPVETATQDALCEVPGSVTITSASPAEWNYTLVDAQSTTVSSGTLTNGSVTVTNVALGDYELTLTEVQSGYSAVETVTVNGTAAVVAQAIASSVSVEEGQEIQFTANAQNADTYSWNFGDGMTSADVNPLHTYNTAGTYEVILTASNSTNTCSAVSTLSVTVSEVATSSVEEVDADNVKMWNLENTVFISFGSEWAGKTTFTLYDAAGKRVMNKQLNNAQGTVTVDCGVLAAGTYTAELSNGKKVVTHKAIMGIK